MSNELNPWCRTGAESVLVVVPGNWFSSIPGGMTQVAYQNYPNFVSPVILAGKPGSSAREGAKLPTNFPEEPFFLCFAEPSMACAKRSL